jgi:hypothetical protein
MSAESLLAGGTLGGGVWALAGEDGSDNGTLPRAAGGGPNGFANGEGFDPSETTVMVMAETTAAVPPPGATRPAATSLSCAMDAAPPHPRAVGAARAMLGYCAAEDEPNACQRPVVALAASGAMEGAGVPAVLPSVIE